MLTRTSKWPLTNRCWPRPRAGVPQVKAVAERSLRQKQEMADWINQQVPVVTRDYLRRVQ